MQYPFTGVTILKHRGPYTDSDENNLSIRIDTKQHVPRSHSNVGKILRDVLSVLESAKHFHPPEVLKMKRKFRLQTLLRILEAEAWLATVAKGNPQSEDAHFNLEREKRPPKHHRNRRHATALSYPVGGFV